MRAFAGPRHINKRFSGQGEAAAAAPLFFVIFQTENETKL